MMQIGFGVLILSAILILYSQYRIWGVLKLMLRYLRAVTDSQQDAIKDLGTKVGELDKNVSIAGRVLDYIEQETQILQKRREQAEQIRQRFPTRTPR